MTEFGTWSYETDRPCSLEALRKVAAKLPASVYRAKGVIHTEDAPGRRAILQVVGKRVDIELADEWGDRPRVTRIVAIGAHGAVNEAELHETFESCFSVNETT